jgi:hypothetical protein
MVSLMRSRSVLQLGKALVEQLEAEDDLLASWMAHYIAERIGEAEDASGDAKVAAEESAARAILELWNNRNFLPAHLRPFDKLEPIQRALASFDTEETDYRYYPAILREVARTAADKEVQEWLELAVGLDYSARILIKAFLRAAAQSASEQAEPWIELALQAGADGGIEHEIVNFVRGVYYERAEDKARHSTMVSNQISRLESFAELAASIAKDLRADLELGGSEMD